MQAQDSPSTGPRSLKILVNAVSSVMGGGITVVQNLTRSMAEERPSDHFILYCSHDEVASFTYPSNVEVVHLPALLARLRRWSWEQRHLPKLAHSKGADLILVLGGYLSFRSDLPQVAVWQNPNVFSPSGISRPISERLLILAQRFVQGASMKRAVQNVFLTHNSRDLASEWWDMDRFPTCVIHSGVDAEQLVVRDAAPLEKRERMALAVGHTYSHKNYETMIDAIAVFRERFDEPLRLRIIGDPANPQYFQALQARIEKQGLTDLVEMSGGRPREDVLSAMAQASIYLVTSQLETFGLTMFEAMGQGLPVVASDATCHPEVCGDAAVYCDPHDPVDVAERLHQVLSDRDLAERMRSKGYERLEEFSWTRSARGYLAQIDAAVAGEVS